MFNKSIGQHSGVKGYSAIGTSFAGDCHKADIPETYRQFSKWNRGIGKASMVADETSNYPQRRRNSNKDFIDTLIAGLQPAPGPVALRHEPRGRVAGEKFTQTA